MPHGQTYRRRRTSALGPLVAIVSLVALCGANCPQMVRQYSQPLPRALPQAATLQQIIDVVNDNSNRVQSLYCTHGSVSVPGFPALRLSLAYDRPRNIRLRAETAITGPEVDLGSNADQFWFWIRRAQPPVVYYCRHDRYATSAARQVVPVEPDWITAALGIVTFDPAWQHSGPFPVGGGRIEIRSVQPANLSPEPVTRITVIDESRGVVLEQHMYNASGQRLATAVMSKHQRDLAANVTLPRKVEILWPSTQFELTMEMTDLQVNRLVSNPQLFVRPEYPGYKALDLADMNFPPSAPPASASGPGSIRPPQAAPAAMRSPPAAAGYPAASSNYATAAPGYAVPSPGYTAAPPSYATPAAGSSAVPPGYSAAPTGYVPTPGYSSATLGGVPSMPSMSQPGGSY